MQTQNLLPDEVFPAAIRLINRELLPDASPKKQRVLGKVARILEKAQRQIEQRYKRTGVLPAMYMGITPPGEAEDLRAWGRRLRLRREEAGLTRAQLAALAGVADSTIRNLETGRHKPTRPIVMRLQAVPALGMPSPYADSPLASLHQQTMSGALGQDGFSCNCWFAPEYDSIKIAKDMVQRFNGTGGHIEQTFLYTDPASAAAWCAITAQEGYERAQAAMPITDVARVMAQHVNPWMLDVIGLGCGEAKDEVRLVQGLLGEDCHNQRLFLLDISQPLLSAGYKHAANVLGDLRNVDVFAIQGNFHNLPSYTPLLESPRRRRMVCMFGQTFSNLENEILFVRNSLCGLSDGDLLLLDVPMVCAPADKPDEIMQKDPRLSNRLPESLGTIQSRMSDFFIGPFQRHVRGFRGVKLSCLLDKAACPVPGSYAVDWRARVKTTRSPDREFSFGYSKRYDPDLLDACMKEEGWLPIECWRYAEEHHPRLLLLYKKGTLQ